MPTVNVSSESMGLLLEEAKKLGATIKDIADKCIDDSLGSGLVEGVDFEDDDEDEDEE